MKPRLFIISTATRFRGGEFQALLLANGLRQQNYPVTIACNEAGPFRNTDCPEARWIRFRHRHGLDLRGILVLTREITAAQRPVLLCNDSKALTLGWLVSRLKRVPLLAIRRVYFPFAKNHFSQLKYRSCTRIVAISKAIAERCRSTLPGCRITVIPSSTTPVIETDKRGILRNRLGFNPENQVCLSVADFTNPGKQFPFLLKTASLLHRRYPEFRLLLVGKLPDTREPLPSWCISTGFSSAPLDYYAAADLYLCTSRHEGLGTAILDAVVRDIPAVAPAAGGAGDLFTDDAWLADEVHGKTFLQRMCEILDNPTEARLRAIRYGEHARGWFSRTRVVDAYRVLIDEIAGTIPLSSLEPIPFHAGES